MQKYYAILYYAIVFFLNILFISQWLCVCVCVCVLGGGGGAAYSLGGFCPKGLFVPGHISRGGL